MRKARKKPITISYFTFSDLVETKNIPNEILKKIKPIYKGKNLIFKIETLEGNMIMTNKDHLLVGIKNEIYPCKIKIFNETYEKIEEVLENGRII